MSDVAFVIQHHPARAELLPRLLGRLEDPIVVTDPGGEKPSAWRCYRECLRADVGDATHIVVIQDDATVCDFFPETARAAIAAKPAAAIAFFLSPQCRRSAHEATLATKKRVPWAVWSRADFWPTVCAGYPVAVARQMADWVDRKNPAARGDDAPAGDFFRAHPLIPAALTVPSLAEHLDDVPSLIGRKYMSGRNPARLARWFIGEKDPRSISWSN